MNNYIAVKTCRYIVGGISVVLIRLEVWCYWQAFVLAVLRFLVVIAVEKNGMGVARKAYGERSGVNRVLVGKPEGKRPPG
jgi:hypothetical protein